MFYGLTVKFRMQQMSMTTGNDRNTIPLLSLNFFCFIEYLPIMQLKGYLIVKIEVSSYFLLT